MKIAIQEATLKFHDFFAGIGGAVDPNVARWLGQRIMEAVS